MGEEEIEIKVDPGMSEVLDDDDLLEEEPLFKDEQRPDQYASEQYVRIRLAVAVNGYKRGDELTVERGNPLFAGLIKQQLAEVI